jgi:hypothetical protein
MMKRSVFFFSSKFDCINFKNTVIISVIGVSLVFHCDVSFFLSFCFIFLTYCSSTIILLEALVFNPFYLVTHLSNHESISFNQATLLKMTINWECHLSSAQRNASKCKMTVDSKA